MADEVPIWSVIEEFKEKIKVQEIDLKQRRENLDSREEKLQADEKEMSSLRHKLNEKEAHLVMKEAEMAKLEQDLTIKLKELQAKEGELAELDEQIHKDRSFIERRQSEISAQEAVLLGLVTASAAHEVKAKEVMTQLASVEEKLLEEENKLRRAIEETSGRREELLAKEKVVEEQSKAIAENKAIMIEQQMKLVEWERTLNERERAFTARPPRTVKLTRDETTYEAPESLVAPPGRAENPPEPSASSGPIPTEEAGAIGPVEIPCPKCKTLIDPSSSTCWACGINIAEYKPEPTVKADEKHIEEPEEKVPVAHVPEEAQKEEKVVETDDKGEVKRSVAIRKIIRRK